jgi:hypothetical protein
MISGAGTNMAGYALLEPNLKKKVLMQMLAIYSELLFKNVISTYVDCKAATTLESLIDEAAFYKKIKAPELTVDLKLKALNKQGYLFALFADNAVSANAKFWNALHDISTTDQNCVILADASLELFSLFDYRSPAFRTVKHQDKNSLNNTKIRLELDSIKLFG